MIQQVAILGAGAFGTALGGILANKGYDVDYYDPLRLKKSLADVVNGAKYIFLCTPSDVVTRLLSHLPKKTPLIITTKGFLDDKAFSDFSDWIVISGPGFASDLKAGKTIKLTTTDKRVVELLETNSLQFDLTDDRLGVLMCGALKNVYAILAGFLGLKKGTVEWKNYIHDVSEEIQALLSANGANKSTFELACGRADLELTCNLPSRNYEYGQNLRENTSFVPEKTVEGLCVLQKLKRGEIIIPDSIKLLKILMEKI